MYFLKLIFMFIFSSVILLSKTLDYNCDEKIELINKLLEKPDDYYNIIKNSTLYSDSIYADKTLAFKRFNWDIKKIMKEFKGNCVLSHDFLGEDFDTYILHYLGGNYNLFPVITIRFFKINDKWCLRDIVNSGPSLYFFSSKLDLEFMKGFEVDYNTKTYKNSELKFIRTRSKVKKENYLYWNNNFDFCDKYDFLNKIINDSLNLYDVLKNSKFTKNNYKFFENSDSSIFYLREYLSKYQIRNIWINYPFPIYNEYIDEYLKTNNEKDYFIIEFKNENTLNYKPKYLTIEFINADKIWYLNKVIKGTLLYIADHSLVVMPPCSE